MSELNRRIRSRRPWRAFVAVGLVVLAGSWMADWLRDLALAAVGATATVSIAVLAILSALLFTAASLWLYDNRQAFSGARTVAQADPWPHSSLVLLVSRSKAALSGGGPGGPFIVALGAEEVVVRGESLADDIAALDKLHWNWQQLLRALEPHRPPVLRRVRLIGSPGPTGSFEQLDACSGLLQPYVPDVTILPAKAAVDFDNVDALIAALREVIEEERATVREHEILIDVTGGKKMTSVAAAVATLNSRVKFQYVDTESAKVTMYDVVYDSPVTPGA